MEDNFFCVTIRIYHANPIFNKVLIENYIKNTSFRFRDMLSIRRSLLKNDFFCDYGNYLTQVIRENLLVFRSKSKDFEKSHIEIMNIWRFEKHFKIMDQKYPHKFVFAEMKRQGFQPALFKSIANKEALQKKIKVLHSNVHKKIIVNKLNIHD